MTTVTLIQPGDFNWADILDEMYPLLDAPNNETLFPLHFTQIVLPKIGGKLAVVERERSPVALGMLFPRKVSVAPPAMGGVALSSPKLYSLRLHLIGNHVGINNQQLWQLINDALGGDAKAILYEIGVRNNYRASAQALGTLDGHPLTIGQPSHEESKVVQLMHGQIWQGGPGTLYPVDVHSREFGLATDLVARVGDEVVGFLIGFYKDGGAPLPGDWWETFTGGWRIESQVMGVLPTYRGQHLGYLLKRAQGEFALRNGVKIVNWTADPLQFPNAVLNFGKLGAVAFDFYPDLYPFRNELNRVPASRFGLTWLVGTQRVRSRPLDSRESPVVDVRAEGILKLNHGRQPVETNVEQARIAIEIPANWTTIQQEDVELALEWRTVLDSLLQKYIGIGDGQYCVTGVGMDEERCYLIAERSVEALWARLAG